MTVPNTVRSKDKILSFMDKLSNTDSKNFRNDVLTSFKDIYGLEKSVFWLYNKNNEVCDPITLKTNNIETVYDYYDNFIMGDRLSPYNTTLRESQQKVFTTFDIHSKKQYEQSQFYKNYMKKYDYHSSAIVFLKVNQQPIGVLGFSFLDESQFLSEEDSMSLEIISRYIEKQFELYMVTDETNFETFNLHLTKREKEVLKYLIQGDTYQTIADRFFISENTVKKHIQSLYGKFQVHNRTQLSYKIRMK